MILTTAVFAAVIGWALGLLPSLPQAPIRIHQCSQVWLLLFQLVLTLPACLSTVQIHASRQFYFAVGNTNTNLGNP